ncbi:MAG: SPOR domain-containing protein [Sideroxydans sp.]|nr:SPOR domain-containing protein [Sideroxydans sp.]
MAKGSSNSSGGGSPNAKVFAALIVGMVLGLAIAGFIAWYVVEHSDNAFSKKEVRETPKVEAPAVAPVVKPPVVATSAVNANPNYEFYKALPDKVDAPHQELDAKSPAAKAAVKAASDTANYFVQAASFQNVADAEKLKAKLALLGMEASVQSADVAGKGVYHRVRLGPYVGLSDANAAIVTLQQNGISNATAVRVQ